MEIGVVRWYTSGKKIKNKNKIKHNNNNNTYYYLFATSLCLNHRHDIQQANFK